MTGPGKGEHLKAAQACCGKDNPMRVVDLIADTRHPHASVDDTLAHIEEIIVAGDSEAVPLLDRNGRVFGVVDSRVIARAHMSRQAPEATNCWELCEFRFPLIGPDASLDEALSKLTAAGGHYLVVSDNKRYLGMLTAEDLLKKIKLLEDEDKVVRAPVQSKKLQ